MGEREINVSSSDDMWISGVSVESKQQSMQSHHSSSQKEKSVTIHSLTVIFILVNEYMIYIGIIYLYQ